MIKISVIICTHNPRQDYLTRVLSALRQQTISKKAWELLLIDNASDEVLSKRWDLSWHPHGGIIREKKLGLTQARLRGILEARGDILVFVDDDNVLQVSYLQKVLCLAKRKKNWGVWSGSALAKYENEPHKFWKKFERFLCIRKITKELESTSLFDWEAMPHGAGMVVRKKMAKLYAKQCKKNRARQAMDRTGSQLISGGDNDIALCAFQAGFRYGVTPRLCLTHLIPAERVRPKYILKIIRGSVYSNHLLNEIYSGKKSKCFYFRDIPRLLKKIDPFKPRKSLVLIFQIWGNLLYVCKKM